MRFSECQIIYRNIWVFRFLTVINHTSEGLSKNRTSGETTGPDGSYCVAQREYQVDTINVRYVRIDTANTNDTPHRITQNYTYFGVLYKTSGVMLL